MGGAMLWATGKVDSQSPGGYFVSNNSATWPSPIFRQGTVIADPILFTYSDPFGTVTARGMNIALPYPYLVPDVGYETSCGTEWQTAPLTVLADPIPTLLMYPATVSPVGFTQDTVWMPTSILVDKMGDYSTDLIYQNPAAPYVRTSFTNSTGIGEYIKCTIVQGSPYIFCECRGIPLVVICNRITTNTLAVPGLLQPATAPLPVPGVTNVQYSLIAGDQIDPGQFNESHTLNPLATPALQDNFTTWAVYFKNDPANITFVPSSATTAPQNNYFQLSTVEQAQKFYFVLAAIPTIFQYPHGFADYTAATAAPGNDVTAYAEALGQYAFNFVTNTAVSYQVTDKTFVQTTFASSLTNAYNDPMMVAATNSTVLCLMPHHYQNQAFTPSVSPTVLSLGSSVPFAPVGGQNLFYWSLRGNLQAILGNSFQTNYVFSNFLPSMPPPYWTDCVHLTMTNGQPYAVTTVGQFLFDNLDGEYDYSLTPVKFRPWGTLYQTEDKGIYDVGKTLVKAGKELGLLLEFLQGLEENTATSSTFNTFFYTGVDSTIYTECSSYQQTCTLAQSHVLVEQTYNFQLPLPNRPGAFNSAFNNTVPSKGRLQSLRDALNTSVLGSLVIQTGPELAGVRGAIVNYFMQTPTPCQSGYALSHFAYYNPAVHLVMLYPAAGSPLLPSPPWPGQIQTPPIHKGAGIVWEDFGVANAFDDHDYQYGYWISAAALAGLYDGTWNTPVSGSTWISSSQYGGAIDQLVQDLVYDPLLNSTFYHDPGNQMQFAKMNFFDQWAGHGWADGIQATIAGGNAGHNENSIGEALQAYASVILWGMTTARSQIVDLGIYLYATNAYAMDSYFFDKNLNLAKGQPATVSFVPTTTATTSPTYPAGSAFIDFTIHSTTSSGTPKIAQSVINYSTDFGQTPLNIKLITAFPCNAWSLVFGRNEQYLNAWNASMDTCAFNSTIDTGCWFSGFVANMNMLRALGGNSSAIGPIVTSCPASYTPPSQTPYEYMLQLFSMAGAPQGCPPWGFTAGTYVDPSQTINEVVHFLHVIDHYGTLNWTVYGRNASNPDGLVFTAAFTKGATTSYFAFNPTLAPITVQFYEILTQATVSGATFQVQPKRWGSVSL
jgi:endoglucanase Acf2